MIKFKNLFASSMSPYDWIKNNRVKKNKQIGLIISEPSCLREPIVLIWHWIWPVWILNSLSWRFLFLYYCIDVHIIAHDHHIVSLNSDLLCCRWLAYWMKINGLVKWIKGIFGNWAIIEHFLIYSLAKYAFYFLNKSIDAVIFEHYLLEMATALLRCSSCQKFW